MPSAADYSASRFVKMLLIGNSGAGKTGALTPLVKAGYKVRILDMDQGLDALINHVKDECPDKLGNIDYMSFRDQTEASSTGIRVRAKALVKAMQALEKWEDGSDPATWGEDTIFVLDSLTFLGRAALAWSKAANPSFKDGRLWYGPAQGVLEDTLATLTSEDFKTNVIVISHVDVREQKDGTVKGFAMSVGEALGPKIPAFFNTVVLSETSGFGQKVKRRLKTFPTSLIDLKNPAPMKFEAEYPIETGLADIFKTLKS